MKTVWKLKQVHGTSVSTETIVGVVIAVIFVLILIVVTTILVVMRLRKNIQPVKE